MRLGLHHTQVKPELNVEAQRSAETADGQMPRLMKSSTQDMGLASHPQFVRLRDSDIESRKTGNAGARPMQHSASMNSEQNKRKLLCASGVPICAFPSVITGSNN